MKFRIAGALFVTLVLALPAQAQQLLTYDQALTDQLTTNGVADPADATGEELVAAIDAIVANNPDLALEDLTGLVEAAARRNPAAYQTIALAGARAANSLGGTANAIASIIATAITAANNAGIDTDGASSTLAAAASAETGQTITAGAVEGSLGFFTTDVFAGLDFLVIIEENPNQDASPS